MVFLETEVEERRLDAGSLQHRLQVRQADVQEIHFAVRRTVDQNNPRTTVGSSRAHDDLHKSVPRIACVDARVDARG